MRIVLVIALLVFGLQAKSLFSNKEQESNAKYLNELKNLVIATQKTRGLTNSYMNGSESALLLIQANKRDMKKAIGEMESLPLSENPIISNRATSISQSLIKLNSKALSQKASKTFEEYTEQIQQILMLAQTVSKQGSKELNKFGKQASNIMMETILPLTEQIGRMRGMGSGIIAKHKISKQQKLALQGMLVEIDSLESKLQNEMSALIASNQHYYKATTTRDLGDLHNTVKSYSKLTNQKVLAGKVSGMSSSEYFDKGTEIITFLMKIFDANKKAIITDSDGWL
jgi:hypothetical protein